MRKSKEIEYLVDYILLNAFSLEFSGLYNGKAGLALTLFEVARIRDDEYIEEHAFELLQEALLSKNTDVSFEQGLSGIAFVLLYLVKYRFIDADFEELFGVQINKILESFEQEEKSPLTYNSLEPVRFFLLLKQLSKDTRADKCIDRLFDKAECFLSKSFSEILNLRDKQIISKFDILRYFEHYLNICILSDRDNNINLLETYAKIYEEGFLPSRFSIGHNLKTIATKYNNDFLRKISDANINFSKHNICFESLSLSNKIEFIYSIANSESINLNEELNFYKSKLLCYKENNLESFLIKSILQELFIAGYKEGISRYLLWRIYETNRIEGNDCDRFKYIF